MNAKTVSIQRQYEAERTFRRDPVENRLTARLRDATGKVERVGESGEPRWELLYSPNDSRRDLIAFGIALAVTIMTLALTNLGFLG